MIQCSDHSNPDKSLQPGRKVSLKPLAAQVGGHVYMKLLNDNYVCKPLNDREVNFYQNTPKNLLQHVPKYLGTVQIQQQQLEEDTNCRLDSLTPASEYIVLENLTIEYNKPCILDLKMGTRHYGDFASEAKRKSQKKKSKKTTSGKLGIRFCGSQRFSYTQGNFETLDKYVGRNADESELKTLLKKFFTCGGALRTEVIDLILEKIIHMRQTLLELHQYRFYSSSLLIIYEGQPLDCGTKTFEEDKTDNSMDCEQFDDARTSDNNVFKKLKQEKPKVTMKIIDFANVSLPVSGSGTSSDGHQWHEGPDDGFIMGLDNFYQILQTIVEEQHFFM